jgi:hypothetical protein
MVHLISYDLTQPNDRPEDYTRVIDRIKTSFPAWAHVEESVWAVQTPLSAAAAFDQVAPAFKSGDKLHVARQSGAWKARNLPSNVAEWLKNADYN